MREPRELEFHVLAPNEPIVDIMHNVMQARGEGHQRLFQAFNLQGAEELLVGSLARWEEHQRMLTILEQQCQELSQAIPVVDGAVAATSGSSFRSFSPSVAPGTHEEMSTPSREQCSLDRERGCWNADLEGGTEKLTVEGAVFVAANGSKNPDGKADLRFE